MTAHSNADTNPNVNAQTASQTAAPTAAPTDAGGNNDSAHQAALARQGAEDSGRYFHYMAEYVGFTAADAQAIKESKHLLEKHLPEIVAKFYEHVLRYPPTRKFFLKQDGSLNQEYLELRMRHLTNFWLRTADGIFDEDYARYVDYVGRAHTSRGADPTIYIAERYVIGQVGMIQNAISAALDAELHNMPSEVQFKTMEAWDKLMMVILEMLSRAYGQERDPEAFYALEQVDKDWLGKLAKEAVALEDGSGDALPTKDVVVCAAADIPDGERKIVQVDTLSIGVFHHAGQWYAVRNSCIHRGGPVATGKLVGDVLVCPWHGFQYDIKTAKCLADPLAELDHYPVSVIDGQVHLQVPDLAAAGAAAAGATLLVADAPPPAATSEAHRSSATTASTNPAQGGATMSEGTSTVSAAGNGVAAGPQLQENQFRIADVPPGKTGLVSVGGDDVAVYNVDGAFYATANACTHADGPLNEGELKGNTIICPWHFSCFDVTTGAATCRPATEPVQTYKVTVSGEIGTVTA